MTQAVITQAPEQTYVRRVISVETIAIIILAALSLLLRLTMLDTVPLTEPEIAPALAAWRDTMPNASGSSITPNSAMLYWSQQIGFLIFDNAEYGARFFTALAGVMVTLSPLLFRDLLGRARAYLFAVLLVFSPVLLGASRLSSPVVWSVLFAALMLWALWRYWETRQTASGILAMVFAGGLILLSEPGGIVLALLLAGAGGAALFMSAVDAPDSLDVPGNDFLQSVRERFSGFPWQQGTVITATVVIALCTGFLINPDGLSTAAAAVGGFFSGFVESMPDRPLFFPLVASLFYEFWMWILAVVAIFVMVRRREVIFVERFFAAWVIFGGVAALIYQGGGAAHALWLIIPLTGLVSYLAASTFIQDDVPALWLDILDDNELEANSARWGKYLLAFVTFALLVMAAVHFQMVSRGFLNVPGGSLTELMNRLNEPGFNNVIRSLIWLVISVLFIIVGYFLAASIWGNIPAARGGLLGLFTFVIMSNLSAGWHVAVDNTDNPAELWHVHATLPDAPLLRETMLELSSRETQGIPMIPAAVVGADDTLIAWLLRDFPNLRFVDHISEARTEQVIIMAEEGILPDLGGSYLGQRFDISQRWRESALQGFDILPWWSVRQVRPIDEAGRRVVLWVRQDIWNSQPFTPNLPNLPGVG